MIRGFARLPSESWYRRLAGCVLLVLAVAVAAAFDFDRIERQLVARFGQAQVPLLRDWQRVLAQTRPVAEADKLKKVNEFINRRIAFDEDLAIWNLSDYWATPLETIGQDAPTARTMPSSSITR